MPWLEATPMDHRLQFVAEARRTDESFTALCARYGIAPKTGYKWLARWVNMTHLLGTEYVSLGAVGDGLWQVYFGAPKLGRFDERLLRIIDRDGSISRNPRRLSPMSSD